MRLADVEFTARDKVLIARVTGEVDLSNAERLREVLADATENHVHALVLDFSELDYLDSAGIQLIYRLRESLRARGQELRLVIPSDSPVRHALRLAGVAASVEMLESVEEAIPLSA